jgi:hypothetical protein
MLNRFFPFLALAVFAVLVAAMPNTTNTALGNVVSRQGTTIMLKVDAANVSAAKKMFNGQPIQVAQLVDATAGTWGSIGTAKVTDIQFSGADVMVVLQVLNETQPQGQTAYAVGARIKLDN